MCKILEHFFWLRSSGRLPQCEDSTWYIDYATALMTNCKIGLHMNDILYFGYNILLTVLLAIFKDTTVIIFLQGITASLSVIFVFKIARMLFNRSTAIIASIFYFMTYDITLWAMYILSDSFFISLLLLCVYLMLMWLDTDQKGYKIGFFLTLAYMFVFRPTGILTGGFILLYLLIRLDKEKAIHHIYQYRWSITGLLMIVSGAGIYLYIGNTLDPLISSIQFNAKKVLYNIYAKGWIYDKPTVHDYFFRPNYAIDVWNSLIVSFIVNNWDHVMVLYGKRAVAFLGRWVWQIDFKSIYGIFFFVSNLIPILLFLTGTIASIKNGLFKRASILWLLVFAAFAFCILVFIDWMYRYKLPAMPFIAMIAAYGAERVLRRVYYMLIKR
jgi:4-amino-4-deoxy-L-arabinose transferase-like glycosyltransferase